jgi:UPF0716 protein FxsA
MLHRFRWGAADAGASARGAPAVKRILRSALPAYVLLEAFLTLTIASWLGPGPTLLLLALGVAAGIAVLRTEQFALLSRLSRIFTSGEPLFPGLLDGALRGAAGVLLIMPGFISDLAAAGLLLPPLRKLLVRRLSAGLSDETAGAPVIQGDYRRIDDPTLPAQKGEPY